MRCLDVGVRLTQGGVGLAFVLGFLTAIVAGVTEKNPPVFEIVTIVAKCIVIGCALLVAAGLIVGTVGRCLCLATPPGATAARAWIRLTVVFDVCSLLSGAAQGVNAAGVNLLPPPVVTVGIWFAVVAALTCRFTLIQYARSLATFTGDRGCAEDAKKLIQRIVGGLIAGMVGVFLIPISEALGKGQEDFKWVGTVGAIAGVIVAFGAALALLGAVEPYAKLIEGLRLALASYTPVTPSDGADDPDREYRERYYARGGTEGDPDDP